MANISPKVDAFLLKRLPRVEYERIRICEIAIVDANGTLRFVALSDENLYLIDSSVKNMKGVLNYGDVVSVNYEHNYVPFLNGEDRENCQHVRIVYRNSAEFNPEETLDATSGFKKLGKQKVLDLYIRSKMSPFCAVLKNSCTSHAVKQTKNSKDDSSKETLCKPEHMKYLFQQLQEDILQSHDSVEDMYFYLKELLTAAQRSFSIKKLFWKNYSVLDCLLDQLAKYSLNSSVNVANSQARGARCDELDLCSILFDLIAEMFGETELLPDRSSFLVVDEFTYSRKLVRLCLNEPLMPESFSRPTKTRATAKLFDSFCKSESKKFSIEEELLVSYCNFLLSSQSLLFELVLAGVEMKWVNPSNRYDIKWLMQQITKNGNIKEYMRALIWLAMVLLDLTIPTTLNAHQSLWVYQIFGLTQNLMDYNYEVAQFIKEEFQEEFKYFFLPGIVSKRLDGEIPITEKIVAQMKVLHLNVVKVVEEPDY